MLQAYYTCLHFFSPLTFFSFSLTQLCSTFFILANESLPTHARDSKTPTDQRQGKEMPELFAEIWQRLFFARGQRNRVFSRDPEQGEVRDWLLPQGFSVGRAFCLLQLHNVFSMP